MLVKNVKLIAPCYIEVELGLRDFFGMSMITLKKYLKSHDLFLYLSFTSSIFCLRSTHAYNSDTAQIFLRLSSWFLGI